MTKFSNFRRVAGGSILVAAALTLMAGTATAKDVCLRAMPFSADYAGPGGTAIPMWGYATVPYDAGCVWTGLETPSVPGPRITVDSADPALNIHLTNDLPVPTSLVIPGQVAPLSPVWVEPDGATPEANLPGITGGRTNTTMRIRSVTHETMPGLQGTYSWSNLAPGTQLYRSGTMPQVQVQMGLYGGMSKDSGIGEAYPGVPYNNDAMLVYSEIDPALHAAVAGGTYGTGLAVTSTFDYQPKFFLINGTPYDPADPVSNQIPLIADQTALLRFVNAGLQNHVPTALGLRMNVVAEDGNKYPFARNQHSLLVPAGSTRDAIVTPQAGEYPLVDGMGDLTNNGAGPGGMLAYLVAAVSDPLVATDDAYSTDEDAGLAVAALDGVLGNDLPNTGEVATLIDNVAAAAGAVTLNADGSFSYAAVPDFNGSATFTYRTTDGVRYSNLASVTITVNPVNDAPVAVADSGATPYETAVILNVLGNDTDIDGDMLTAAVSVAPANGSAVVNPDNTITYTPNPAFSGIDSFEYTASDPGLLTSSAIVTITVDAPPALFAADDAYATDEDVALNVLAPGVLGNDTPLPGETAVLVANVPAAAGNVVLAPDGSFVYTPALNFYGAAVFTYKKIDGIGGESNVASVTITVNPVNNDAPVAADDTYSTTQGTALVLTAPGVLGNDIEPDGQALTAVWVSDPANGTLALGPDGSFTYTPNAPFYGSDSFQYAASDGDAGTLDSLATVTITVNGAPIAGADAYVTIRDTALTVPPPGVLVNDSDPESDPMTISLVSGTTNGTLTWYGNGGFIYTPAAGYVGPDSFTYEVSDGLQATAATVSITVEAPPVMFAADDVYPSGYEDIVLTVAAPGVLGNDTVQPGDTAVLDANVAPEAGAVALAADGSFVYTPAANYSGTATFTYHTTDAGLVTNSNVATVTITVTARPDAPFAGDDAYETMQDTDLVLLVADTILLNDGDADGDTLRVSLFGDGPANGTVSYNNGQGRLTYRPNAGFVGVDSFQYSVSDGDPLTPDAVATVTVTVTAVLVPPTAVDDSATV
ncbi:MAG: Ig-like domain-containing protein, partial [Alphaproteobacteria bacterium]|nr:Ig-like domain-containing protein [Alphaproteobacteria bacterium]